MTYQLICLAAAGVIGSITAVIHGVLTQRHMVAPIEKLLAGNKAISGAIRRLVPVLLHVSTAAWFAGGLALIAAALWFGPGARLATGALVGTLYLYAALGNLWATRGRHPGWMLMALALVLIVVGLAPFG